MKDYDDIMKEHGYTAGLWNDPFTKKYVMDSYKEDKRRLKLEKKMLKKQKTNHK